MVALLSSLVLCIGRCPGLYLGRERKKKKKNTRSHAAGGLQKPGIGLEQYGILSFGMFPFSYDTWVLGVRWIDTFALLLVLFVATAFRKNARPFGAVAKIVCSDVRTEHDGRVHASGSGRLLSGSVPRRSWLAGCVSGTRSNSSPISAPGVRSHRSLIQPASLAVSGSQSTPHCAAHPGPDVLSRGEAPKQANPALDAPGSTPPLA